ncbi:SlyX family protein [Aquabacterium sp. A7-Y]|uniref:SlyX family protein n=1 Tax=Aquabacterium sp. A7-Y TaxID=1349605 RepID=UPI00223D16F2|nr:SlyX family protein [Aquabacterium sp. A7-Y]MCW7537029.1 SlyX family protein [Aquabacterium sp. A7-Y]
MERPHPLEQRVTDLEVKAGFTEDLLDHLNEVVARQQQQIELLMREILQLRQQNTETGGGLLRNLREELPPHY